MFIDISSVFDCVRSFVDLFCDQNLSEALQECSYYKDRNEVYANVS
jgi:hypothetical protein